MQRTKVAIVGGGPVGLLASLLLNHYHIPNICFQASPPAALNQHVKAHWLSSKSKLILSQVPHLIDHIHTTQQPFHHFTHYRYVQHLLGQQLGATDHFSHAHPDLFGYPPSHISQSILLQIFLNLLHQKNNVQNNTPVTSFQQRDTHCTLLRDNNKICECEYVILCNGVHSKLRDQLKIQMSGNHQLCKIINIHFRSGQLAKHLQRGKQAMLYFVYNAFAPCVLVTHSFQKGVFVLQVPNYQPFVDLLRVYSGEELVRNAIAAEYDIKDIEVVTSSQWRLQTLLASQMHCGRVLLAGDTAHTFTPAGGFGMNAGFQDVNALVHAIKTVLRNPNIDTDSIFTQYSNERTAVNEAYLNKSLENYQITNDLAQELGFPKSLVQGYYAFKKRVPSVPFESSFVYEQIRLLAMKAMFRKKQVTPKLPLIFDAFDYHLQEHSKMLKDIYASNAKDTSCDVFVRENTPFSDIKSIVGNIEPQNIKYHSNPQGQKIIRSDGIILQR